MDKETVEKIKNECLEKISIAYNLYESIIHQIAKNDILNLKIDDLKVKQISDVRFELEEFDISIENAGIFICDNRNPRYLWRFEINLEDLFVYVYDGFLYNGRPESLKHFIPKSIDECKTVYPILEEVLDKINKSIEYFQKNKDYKTYKYKYNEFDNHKNSDDLKKFNSLNEIYHYILKRL